MTTWTTLYLHACTAAGTFMAAFFAFRNFKRAKNERGARAAHAVSCRARRQCSSKLGQEGERRERGREKERGRSSRELF